MISKVIFIISLCIIANKSEEGGTRIVALQNIDTNEFYMKFKTISAQQNNDIQKACKNPAFNFVERKERIYVSDNVVYDANHTTPWMVSMFVSGYNGTHRALPYGNPEFICQLWIISPRHLLTIRACYIMMLREGYKPEQAKFYLNGHGCTHEKLLFNECDASNKMVDITDKIEFIAYQSMAGTELDTSSELAIVQLSEDLQISTDIRIACLKLPGDTLIKPPGAKWQDLMNWFIVNGQVPDQYHKMKLSDFFHAICFYTGVCINPEWQQDDEPELYILQTRKRTINGEIFTQLIGPPNSEARKLFNKKPQLFLQDVFIHKIRSNGEGIRKEEL